MDYAPPRDAPIAAAKVQHSSIQAGQAITLASIRFKPASMTAHGQASAMNEIHVISPYKHHGTWVFDDARVGLLQEPFVAGADTWIDRVVADIPSAEKGFTLIFSSTPFPGHQYRLDWRREEGGGNWYYSADLDMEGWLCPALFRYFWLLSMLRSKRELSQARRLSK